MAANIAAAPVLAWKPVLVAGWPPVALLLSVELLAHRPAGQAQTESGGGDDTEGGVGRDRARDDPLLERARRVDARHRELHQRPVSAESLRRELRIGADRSRQLVALVRASRNGSVRG
ncbi:hypothetical protein [Streptomyces ureilyticus]|uniref:hypothetical protein n=1 Tax=Streptomyces ureilyticus TaxID=1775131 RepID=UPI001F308FB7|nr:hypothetical protein [Streptomyces ureilyticus]